MLIRWPHACTQGTLPYRPTQSSGVGVEVEGEVCVFGAAGPHQCGRVGLLLVPRAPSPAPPALPAAHDGAVQEVLAHGGPQHPQQQTHQQEAGALPEGEAGAPGPFPWGGRCLGPFRPVFAPQPRGSALLSASSPLPQGENPFTDSPEEEKEQEEGEGGALEEGALVDAAGGAEGAEGAPAQPPVPPEPAPVDASPPPPPPPPEEDEEAVPLLGGALERQIRGIPGLDVEADDEEEEGGGGAP